MGTCGKCKHWRKSDSDWLMKEMGECKAIRETWEVRDDAFPNNDRHDHDDWEEVERLEQEAILSAKAVVQDGSDYSATLYSAADFGCVLFEAREPA